MRLRTALVSTVLAAFTANAAPAQNSFVRSTAIPPSKEALDRLNLKMEWGVYLPIESVRDTIQLAQLVDDRQIFVQTKGGVVLAIDAKTGQRQWSFSMPNRFGDAYPVAINSRSVFIVNLSTLYAFDRYTGLQEFSFEPALRLDLPTATISAGPACDEQYLYLTLGQRQVVAFQIPASIAMPDPKLNADTTQGGKAGVAASNTARAINPADAVAGRYPGRNNSSLPTDITPTRGRVNLDVSASLSLQRTPSISVLPTVVPPYTIRDDKGQYYSNTPSISTLPSMRVPYSLRDGEGRYHTKTPSISAMPPSAARVYELNDIRPKAISPKIRWYFVPTEAAAYVPIIASNRLWISTTGRHLVAIDRLDTTNALRAIQADSILADRITAQPAQDGEAGFYPVGDGSLLAVELVYGGGALRTAVRTTWRANIGGSMDRAPVATADGVYVGGAGTGIARVDRGTGDVVWRSAPEDDTLLAVNGEYTYTRNHNGRLHVYDRSRVADAITKVSNPLASINLEGFGIPIANHVNDRILLASDNGLLMCLRDAAPKYASPMPLIPVKAKPAAPKAEEKKEGEAPKAPEAAPEKPPEAPKKDEKKDDKKMS